MAISMFQFILPIGLILALVSKGNMFLTLFGYFPAPDHFQYLMSHVCRILRSQGVPCNVELDDVIIYGEGRERSPRSAHMAISILERAGFKINYSKSVISPTQVINYLGYTLDARRQCFCVQKSKLVKCLS